jgi:hypothetical protein
MLPSHDVDWPTTWPPGFMARASLKQSPGKVPRSVATPPLQRYASKGRFVEKAPPPTISPESLIAFAVTGFPPLVSVFRSVSFPSFQKKG